MNRNIPVTTDIVLIGGGHAHVHVLKAFAQRPLPGVRVTLVTRDLETPYSGMLPGVIAGIYTREEAHIDLARLAALTGTRLFRAEATGLDRAEKRILLAGRPGIAYDILSIDVGITPDLAAIAGAAEHGIAVKPIGAFLAKLDDLQARCRSGAVRRIAVVGGGAGGVELLLSLRTRLRADAAHDRRDPDFGFTLVTAGALLATHNARVQQAFRRHLAAAGVAVHEHCPVAALDKGRILLRDGRAIAADAVLLATQAAPPAWFAATGLALDSGGFLAVTPTLQVANDPDVFAAGDCAGLFESPREKAGVYAVRAGPPLAANLARHAAGRPLRPWHPQRRHLALISNGDRYAVASRGWFKAEGAWLWRVKDFIDRRWMEMYRDPARIRMNAAARPITRRPAMSESFLRPHPEEHRAAMRLEGWQQVSAVHPSFETRALGALLRMRLKDEAPNSGRRLDQNEMRCGGCAAKVGPGPLRRALARLAPEPPGGGVTVGLAAPDDAAVWAPPAGGAHIVATVDLFRSIVDDPYVFGEIAANHALNDIFAMGGTPRQALAIAMVPPGPAAKTAETLFQMLAGARACLDREAVALAGGHSAEGAETALGFSVYGEIDPERILRKGGLRPGDALILTKPIGTGILFAAHMRGDATAAAIAQAIAGMRRSARAAAQILAAHGATAMTDVSGFGLAGHLGEMLLASGAAAELDLAAVPIYRQVRELAEAGHASTLLPENLALDGILRPDPGAAARALLFDPQTAGGLLAGIAGDRAGDCAAELRAAGYAEAGIIGEVPQAGQEEPVIVTRGEMRKTLSSDSRTSEQSKAQ